MASKGTTTVVLPDVWGYCNLPRRINPHHEVTEESTQWLLDGGYLVGEEFHDFAATNYGTFASLCYPDIKPDRLRVCSDIISFLWFVDDLAELLAVGETEKVTEAIFGSIHHEDTITSPNRFCRISRDVFRRMALDSSESVQKRFIQGYKWMLETIAQENRDREAGFIPDVAAYTVLRRKGSSCWTAWATLEYANNINLPDEVLNDPVIMFLSLAAIDFISWINDIGSYPMEQRIGITYNMVAVVMNQYGVDAQTAIDTVWAMCQREFERFKEERGKVPSWGAEVDKEVGIYLDGMVDWMAGNMYFFFETKRYFGEQMEEVKKTRVIKLLPGTE